MSDNPHFLSFDNLDEAESYLGFPTVGRRLPHQPLAIAIHVRNHRLRDVEPTLELHYDDFVLTHRRPGVSSAPRLAFEQTYGQRGVATKVGGNPAVSYELGDEPDAADPDPIAPSVVTWADGDSFFMVASDRMPVVRLIELANSLYR